MGQPFDLDPYLGTWTRTREPRPVLGDSELPRNRLCTQIWSNIDGTYGVEAAVLEFQILMH